MIPLKWPLIGTRVRDAIALIILLLGPGIQLSLRAVQPPDFENLSSRPVHQLSRADTGGSQAWSIALDEVAWQDSQGTVRFERITEHASLAELESWMEEVNDGSEERIHLVAYDSLEEENTRGLVSRDIVITLNPDTDPQSVAAAIDAQYEGELAYAPGKHRFKTSNAIDALNAADDLSVYAGIIAVQPQVARWRDFTAVPNDPLYKEQWHLKNTGQTGSEVKLDLNVERAWSLVRGRNIVIGILDSGLAANHPDLLDNVRNELGYDYRDGDDDPSPFLGTFAPLR